LFPKDEGCEPVAARIVFATAYGLHTLSVMDTLACLMSLDTRTMSLPLLIIKLASVCLKFGTEFFAGQRVSEPGDEELSFAMCGHGWLTA
jgi:hypothetical protein